MVRPRATAGPTHAQPSCPLPAQATAHMLQKEVQLRVAGRVHSGLKQGQKDVLQHLLEVGQLALGAVHITAGTQDTNICRSGSAAGQSRVRAVMRSTRVHLNHSGRVGHPDKPVWTDRGVSWGASPGPAWQLKAQPSQESRRQALAHAQLRSFLPLQGTLTRGGAPAPASGHWESALCGSLPSVPACPTRPSNARRWTAGALHSGICSPPGLTSPPRHQKQ